MYLFPVGVACEAGVEGPLSISPSLSSSSSSPLSLPSLSPPPGVAENLAASCCFPPFFFFLTRTGSSPQRALKQRAGSERILPNCSYPIICVLYNVILFCMSFMTKSPRPPSPPPPQPSLSLSPTIFDDSNQQGVVALSVPPWSRRWFVRSRQAQTKRPTIVHGRNELYRGTDMQRFI